jgi:hypothetical protein
MILLAKFNLTRPSRYAVAAFLARALNSLLLEGRGRPSGRVRDEVKIQSASKIIKSRISKETVVNLFENFIRFITQLSSLIYPRRDFIYNVPKILNFDEVEIIGKNGFWSFQLTFSRGNITCKIY